MVDDLTCDVCGKQLKTAAGLAGHKMLAHPGTKAVPSESPELALAEMLGSVKEAYERLHQRLESFGEHFKSLQAQLTSVASTLDGFQASFDAVDSTQIAELEEETARLRKKAKAGDDLWVKLGRPDGFAEVAAHFGYQVVAEVEDKAEVESEKTPETVVEGPGLKYLRELGERAKEGPGLKYLRELEERAKKAKADPKD